MNKFKRHITFITTQMAIAFCVVGYGYTQYTNQLKNTPSQDENTYNYNWDRSNLVSVTTIADSLLDSAGYAAYLFKKYDDNFNVILEKRHVDSNYIYGFGRSMAYHQEAYYVGGYKDSAYYQNDTTQLFLLKFDTLGNKMWEKRYLPNFINSDIKFVLSHDSLVVFCGFTYDTNQPNTLQLTTHVTAIDTSGAVVWQKLFTGYNLQPVNFKKTSDGGFILTAFTQVTAANDTRVYKLDNLGNTQWVQTLGNALDSHWLGAQETPSGDYICYGWKTTPNIEKSWLVKLDNNGNIIKDTLYNFSGLMYNYFNPVGNVIFTNTGVFVVGHYQDDWGTLAHSYLTFFNYDLELQWFRPFGKRTYNDLINFIKPYPPNPEYLFMGGISFSDDTSNTNDEWFIVVDSLGCDVLNCSVGVEELIQEEGVVKVYPNPTNNKFTLQLSDKTDLENVFVQIVDLLGRVILEQQITNTKTTISTQNMSIGIYTLVVFRNGKILYTDKLLKN